MTRRKDIIFRIAAVEREFRAATLAVSALQEKVRHDPGAIGTVAVTPADVRNCAANLEATYLVRMFAVFEEALRDVWASAFARRTRPKTVDLLDGCAAHQHVADRDRVAAHGVREYRNYLLHGTPAQPVTLPEARARLCTFFGRMPPEWA